MNKKTEELGERIEGFVFDARQEDNPRDDSWQRTETKYTSLILKACKEAGLKFVPKEFNLIEEIDIE